MSAHRLLLGTVMHHRHRPVTHRFVYPHFALALDVERLAEVPAPLRVNRRGWLAFHEADHGARDGSPLGPWARRLLAEHGVARGVARITLVTQPRLLGYLFNPVSFYLARDAAGRLRGAIAEVSNTFGEHHNYVVRRPDGGPIEASDRLSVAKVFHVSPFLEVDGTYRFAFDDRPGRLGVMIDHAVGGERLLSTALWGDTVPLSGARLARTALARPLQTVAVTARIHRQALALWLKGVAFHGKPLPPLEETTT